MSNLRSDLLEMGQGRRKYPKFRHILSAPEDTPREKASAQCIIKYYLKRKLYNTFTNLDSL